MLKTEHLMFVFGWIFIKRQEKINSGLSLTKTLNVCNSEHQKHENAY